MKIISPTKAVSSWPHYTVDIVLFMITIVVIVGAVWSSTPTISDRPQARSVAIPKEAAPAPPMVADAGRPGPKPH